MQDTLFLEAKRGSTVALNQLLIASESYASSIVAGFLGNRYCSKLGIEDVVQEVLLKVATDVSTCNARTFRAYLGWLSYVARNETYKQIERLKAKKRTLDRAEGLPTMIDAAIYHPSAEATLVANETKIAILSTASSISPFTYEVALRLIDGMRPGQIASELQVEVSSIYKTLKTFKAAVRQCV